MDKLNLDLINIITQYVGFNPNIEFKLSLNECNWSSLVMNPTLPSYLYIEYEEIIKTKLIYVVRNLNPNIELIEKYKHLMSDMCWRHLCNNPNIPAFFFENCIDKLERIHWIKIIRYNKIIPIEWFVNNIDSIILKFPLTRTLSLLCQRNDVSMAFIEKYMNNFLKTSWNYLIMNEKLPYSFFKKHKNKIPLSAWSLKYITYKDNFKEMSRIINNAIV